jgi:signal transduction histidine kinase
MSFLEAVHPDDLPRVAAMLEAMRRGEPTSNEYRILRPDGSQRWIWDRAFPVRDPNGRVVRIAGISEDITDRKLAEEAIQTEQRLLKQLFETQERERRMVAYDIHDGIVQYATAALLHLEAYRHKLGPNAAPADLEIIEHMLRKTVGEGRRLMTSVRPPVLDEFGLVSAIEHLAAEQQQAGLAVEFRPEPGLGRLADSLEAVLYRIAQEALTNAAKHSRAKKVEISLGQRDSRIRLEVRDSGIGFQLDQIGPESRGLQGIRERVRLTGGTMSIDSRPDRGTRIAVELPLTRPLGSG